MKKKKKNTLAASVSHAYFSLKRLDQSMVDHFSTSGYTDEVSSAHKMHNRRVLLTPPGLNESSLEVYKEKVHHEQCEGCHTYCLLKCYKSSAGRSAVLEPCQLVYLTVTGNLCNKPAAVLCVFLQMWACLFALYTSCCTLGTWYTVHGVQ